MSSNTMVVNSFTVGVHHPIADPNRGFRLAPRSPWSVYNVADYDMGDRLPEYWERGGPNKGSYFVGVHSNRELWFDFNANHEHTHDVAVFVSVQGVNALTGKPFEAVRLEQYRTVCPLHNEPLGSDRFCKSCRHTWPHQNYIAGPVQGGNFWIDGWRTMDGMIRQFVFATAESGMGVAQQILGDARAHGIGFAFYLSVNPKAVRNVVRRRGGSSLSLEGTVTRDYSIGGMTPVPVQTEVSFGRAVDQRFECDPNPLEHWQQTPAGLIVLNHADNAWVQQIVRNGPTVDRTAGGLGPLAGLRSGWE